MKKNKKVPKQNYKKETSFEEKKIFLFKTNYSSILRKYRSSGSTGMRLKEMSEAEIKIIDFQSVAIAQTSITILVSGQSLVASQVRTIVPAFFPSLHETPSLRCNFSTAFECKKIHAFYVRFSISANTSNGHLSFGTIITSFFMISPP